MSNCIGIDVGKQELVVFDGKGHEVFANGEDLSVLEGYLRSRGSDVKVIFEPTSTSPGSWRICAPVTELLSGSSTRLSSLICAVWNGSAPRQTGVMPNCCTNMETART